MERTSSWLLICDVDSVDSMLSTQNGTKTNDQDTKERESIGQQNGLQANDCARYDLRRVEKRKSEENAAELLSCLALMP